MRILHVSDLHVTPPTTLPEVWAPVDAYLTNNHSAKFDFIVVSGDLSQRSEPGEFAALDALVAQDLTRWLVDDDRARIVFVPGNHDVLWKDEHYKPVMPGRDTAAALESFRRDPHRSKYRIQFTDEAALKLWEIDEHEYPKRFENVQAFLDTFYDGSLAGKSSRKFSLLRPGGDWSCHTFLKQGIAFVGLNSCYRNDKHWHGAGFDPQAITAATKHVRGLQAQKPNLLVVAVWHHGFAGDAGRPDRLALVEIGRLYNLGARLGLHGHTHLADHHNHELVHGALRVIATGSLAAGRDALPDRTPNQFSILELGPGAAHVRVETLRLNYQFQYEATAPRHPFAIGAHSPQSEFVPRSSCKVHRRVCRINADGVKHVTVEMQGLLPFGRVQLAVIVPPFGSSSARDSLLFANARHDCVEKDIAGGKRRYTVDLKAKLGDLTWQYDVSNAVALTKEELSMLPVRTETYPNIMGHEDACAFVPTFECDRLELEVQFESAPAFQDARALVERRSDHGSASEWEVDEIETARVAAAFSSNRDAQGHNGLGLMVEHPLVDRRYALVFSPGPGAPYPSEAKFLAKDILRDCRDEPFEHSRLRTDLTLTVGDALTQQLEGEVGEWVAHLWHAEDRVLLPAFGHFPSYGWASHFEAGSGVAGHAFRHSAIVGWCSDVQGFTQAVYRKGMHLPGRGTGEHQWVLCLPLRVGARGPAIGVVGLARSRSTTKVEKRCEGYVRTLAEQPQGNDELMAMAGAVTVAFWTVLTASSSLTPEQREYAKAKLDEFQQPSRGKAPTPRA